MLLLCSQARALLLLLYSRNFFVLLVIVATGNYKSHQDTLMINKGLELPFLSRLWESFIYYDSNHQENQLYSSSPVLFCTFDFPEKKEEVLVHYSKIML